jgi:hypothetical protein
MNSTISDIVEPERAIDSALRRRYVFAGMAIRSSVELAGFPILRGVPDESLPDIRLSVEPQPAPRAEQALFRWPGGYELSLARAGGNWLLSSDRHGSVLIGEEGRSLWCFVDARTGLAGMTELLARRVLARVALLHGSLALHAAAVSRGADALLLLGASGAGKSTLAAALARDPAWTVLNDDFSILRHTGGCAVWPALAGIKLRPDSRAALGVPLDRVSDTAATPRKLRGLVFLDRSAAAPRAELRGLPPADGLVNAARHALRFNPADRREMALRMRQLGETARAVPAFVLRYPDDFARLPEAAGCLRQALGACSGEVAAGSPTRTSANRGA